MKQGPRGDILNLEMRLCTRALHVANPHGTPLPSVLVLYLKAVGEEWGAGAAARILRDVAIYLGFGGGRSNAHIYHTHLLMTVYVKQDI